MPGKLVMSSWHAVPLSDGLNLDFKVGTEEGCSTPVGGDNKWTMDAPIGALCLYMFQYRRGLS